ncbi:sialate O-acetylesterase [Thalassomonas sp. M1454]|uniref:sialate O-acetylesterase n=1 Tax=Thalassomonas sp. M1454 TaxID=2594477 RepID=UPI00163D6CE6|nr:sialate O-acetylesterase [Thalassomonas sp. M1454]
MSCQSLAGVKLADVFSDNMVLQRDKPVNIWGQADPGEAVKVTFSEQSLTTVANIDGTWAVQLAPLSANKHGQQLQVTAQNTQVINNILIGDVWLASGQSNMKYPTQGILNSKEVIAKGNNPLIRLLNIKQKIEKQAQTKLADKWQVSSANSIKQFSALAAVFSQEIQPQLDVPIGIISAAVGSTSVEAWVSKDVLQSDLFAPAVAKWQEVENNWDVYEAAYFQEELVKHQRYLAKMKSQGKTIPPKRLKPPTKAIAPHESRQYPSGSYNGMLHPLFPMTLKGVLWRQGEANMQRGWQYQFLLAEMINLWRSNFKQADLPFIQVQLPEQKRAVAVPRDSAIAETRESQFKVGTKLANVHTVVTIDLQQQGDIHPKNKIVVGQRIASVALNKVYGIDKRFSSPVFSHVKQSDTTLFVYFSDISKGLVTANRKIGSGIQLLQTHDAPVGFAIAGKDKVFHWADAKLINNVAVLSHRDVKQPLYVRYGWADNPEGLNVYDASGGPLMPFRSDTLPAISKGNVEDKVRMNR